MAESCIYFWNVPNKPDRSPSGMNTYLQHILQHFSFSWRTLLLVGTGRFSFNCERNRACTCSCCDTVAFPVRADMSKSVLKTTRGKFLMIQRIKNKLTLCAEEIQNEAEKGRAG